MDNAIYIALSRQTVLFRDMSVIANNIANSSTDGYKKEQMIFSGYLSDGGKMMTGSKRLELDYTQDRATIRDDRMGGLKKTGEALDMAIEGEGYFTVQTPLGERYTRAGSFVTNGEGILVTPQGHPVLDESGQTIAFEPEDTEITLNSDGTLIVNGDERGRIGVVQFANPALLERTDGSMFRSDAAPIPAAENVRVLQGVLETSNVQPVMEMTNMITTMRGVGSTSKFIETMYDLERKAVNALAKRT